jgi:hypothetical protein
MEETTTNVVIKRGLTKYLMTTFMVMMVGCEGAGRQDAVPAVGEEPPGVGAGHLTHRVLLPGLPGIRLAQAVPRQVNQNRNKCISFFCYHYWNHSGGAPLDSVI